MPRSLSALIAPPKLINSIVYITHTHTLWKSRGSTRRTHDHYDHRIAATLRYDTCCIPPSHLWWPLSIAISRYLRHWLWSQFSPKLVPIIEMQALKSPTTDKPFYKKGRSRVRRVEISRVGMGRVRPGNVRNLMGVSGPVWTSGTQTFAERVRSRFNFQNIAGRLRSGRVKRVQNTTRWVG